ncbi:MAG: hypothetical protein JWP57_4206 [Spirosoma sp.]|nr:hypothetical protein [Spirosoma sp.]
MTYPRAIARLLALCIREHDWDQRLGGIAEELRGVNQDLLVEAAQLHRVNGAVFATLQHEDEARPHVLRALREQEMRTIGTQLRVESELWMCAEAFKGVPWLVSKGPVLSRHYYSRPSLRTYGDLDVLVPPQALGDAVSALERSGMRLLDRNWTLIQHLMAGEVHLATPLGGVVDLHWDMVNDRRTRESFSVNTSELFARSRLISVAGQQVRTLDGLDTLVHLALHAIRSGGDRLVWLKDLEQVLLRDRPAWPAIADRAGEQGLSLPVAVMLRRVDRVLSVKVPPGSCDTASARAWVRLNSLVDRVEPTGRRGEGPSLTRMLSRATRSTGSGTQREFLRRLRHFARSRGEGQPDPMGLNPDALLVDAGGREGRQRFFDAVGRTSQDW